MLVNSEERVFTIRLDEPRSQSARSKVSVFTEPGRVSEIHSHYLTGLNRNSNKRWFRWENTGVSTIFLTKDGKIAGKRKMGKAFVSTIDFSMANNKYASIPENLGTSLTFENVFPLASHWGVTDQQHIPVGLAGAMKQDDLPTFVRQTFGKTRYRRDLVKAVGKANINLVGIAKDFRGLVPIDWIVDFLRTNEATDDAAAFGRWQRLYPVRHLLFSMDPRSYRSLLNGTMTRGDWQLLEDVIRLTRMQGAPALAQRRYQSWGDVHDELYQEARAVRRAPTVPVRNDIPLTVIGEKLDGFKLDGYSVVIPKEVNTLVEWGNFMHNCIGSYGRSVARENADVTLGGIYQDGALIVNFEIRHNQLNQFLGRYNRSPGRELCGKFEKVLSAHDIDVKKYWGQVDE